MKKSLFLSFLCAVLLSSSALAQETARELSLEAAGLYSSGKYAASADAYHASIEAGAKSASIYYNAACSNALAGRKDAAFRRLGEAVQHGWRDVAWMQGDADLASLRSDTRWAETLRLCKQAREAFLKTLKFPELHLELMEMQRVDQQIRSMAHPPAGQAAEAGSHSGDHDGHEHDHDGHDHEHQGHDHDGHDNDAAPAVHGDEMLGVDARNTARMKEIVAEYGWPTTSMVGKEGATAAWLLVQHADADPKFQRRCLELMKKVPAGEVSTVDVAYLTDRVLVNEGKKQLYGTQFWAPNGKMEPRPIEDEANLEKRRKEAGMQPFAEYAKHMTGPHDH